MFDISELKTKTLVDLQQIAKTIGLTKFSKLNKLDLVYQILDIQATNPSEEKKNTTDKPKRKRLIKKSTSDNAVQQSNESTVNGDNNKSADEKKDNNIKDSAERGP